METKVCRICNVEKSIIEFRFEKGRQRYRNECKDCENKGRYQRKLKAFITNPETKVRNNQYAVKRQRRIEKERPMENMKQIMRNSIRKSFKRGGFTKKNKNFSILGETWDIVKKHMENNFMEGMSWENHGEWEIDHIIPLSIARNEEQLIKLNHYSNLQPLWRKDNQEKSNKILEEHKGLLHKLLGDDFVIE